jgi:thiol-disulfide isomerase/thioredoxin
MKKVLVAVFVLSFSVFSGALTQKLPLPDYFDPGKPVPWFAVIDGKTGYTPFNLTLVQNEIKKQGAQKVVFAYFATWCVPCAKGLGELAAAKEELKVNKVAVFLVHVGEEDIDKIDRWIKKYTESSWPLLLDRFEVISKGWRFYKNTAELPRTLVLDSKLVPLAFYGEEGTDWPGVLYR